MNELEPFEPDGSLDTCTARWARWNGISIRVIIACLDLSAMII